MINMSNMQGANDTTEFLRAKDFQHDGPHSASHRHPEGQLFVLSRGSASVRVEGGDWMMTPGCPCWVPPHAFHGVESTGRIAGVSIFVSPAHCAGMETDPAVVSPSPFLLALMRRIADGCQKQQQANLLHVLQDELKAAPKHRLYLPMPKHPALEPITEQLLAKPEDRRELAVWASEIGLSSRSLARYFQQETKFSFIQWRSLARIMKSLRLLVEGEQVSTISKTVGYEDASAFIEAFKGVIGSSPRQYALSLQGHRACALAKVVRAVECRDAK